VGAVFGFASFGGIWHHDHAVEEGSLGDHSYGIGYTINTCFAG
jgi:hypothetical protein